MNYRSLLLVEDDTRYLYWKILFSLLLTLYSFRFFTLGVNTEVMQSFIHGPNLIFHEAGHVLFIPFGEFMTLLGGSLGQLLMPFIVVWVFLFREGNPFGASIGLWWLGQNLTDIALYISDAGARTLPLIGGMSEEAHDWGNLLTRMNLLEYDSLFGGLVHYAGMGLMLVALIWGYSILFTTYTLGNQ